jgi:hypothetical protein
MGMNTEKLPGMDKAFENRGPLQIHIEELMLHGFDHLDHAELGRVVEGALYQLISERGAPSSLSQSGHFESLDGGTFATRPNEHSQDIGGQIALAIYRSIG